MIEEFIEEIQDLNIKIDELRDELNIVINDEEISVSVQLSLDAQRAFIEEKLSIISLFLAKVKKIEPLYNVLRQFYINMMPELEKWNNVQEKLENE